MICIIFSITNTLHFAKNTLRFVKNKLQYD